MKTGFVCCRECPLKFRMCCCSSPLMRQSSANAVCKLPSVSVSRLESGFQVLLGSLQLLAQAS